jgi:SAM-dependent methyltransferase
VKINNTQYSYDKQKVKYAANRQTDPVIARQIHNAFGDAKTVLNVGAGAGSYEPTDRIVTAVEPSELMRSQRAADKVPAIAASAEALPFADKTFDTSMAILTIHHWPDIKKGLQEMHRVTTGPVVIMTFDRNEVGKFWLADYCPEMVEVDRVRLPEISFIKETLGGTCSVHPVPVPINCIDGFNEAFYAKPEAFLNESIRRSQSFWDFLPAEIEERAVKHLARDIESGLWEEKYGHLKNEPEFHGALRLVVSV